MPAGTQTEPPDGARLDDEVNALVDEWRLGALWFLRRDYYPVTDADRWRVLDAIQQHCNREAFQRAARLKAWLSHRSSDGSAAP